MKIRPEQLDPHLARPLQPIYLVTGDEPLLVDEALQAIREAARRQGVDERSTLLADNEFDWNQLLEEGASMSLFAERRLLELRLPSGKPGTDGARILGEWAENPPEDVILVVVLPRLDQASRNRRWVKALEGAGAMVEIQTVYRDQLPGWLEQRARARGLVISRDAARFIAERVEGNLVAASQELAKLLLLLGEGQVDDEQVYEAVVDSSRYDPFQLADAAVGGEPQRVVRILEGLLGEGVAPPLIVWVLAREIRALADMSAQIDNGRRMDEVTRRVWNRRRPLVQKALKRYSAVQWLELLEQAGETDVIAKGGREGDVAQALERLALSVASPDAARRFAMVAA